MAERDDLHRAQTFSARAQRQIERAQNLQPLVNSVPPADVVKP